MAKLNIYGCGGTGINIVSSFSKFHGKKDHGFAEINTYFIDTSESNKPKDCDESLFYKLTESNGKVIDGSGKLRKTNAESIVQSSKDMLLRFKPESINLIVHSSGGGSGSVIGPVLTEEMLKRGQLVIVLIAGSSNSRIEVDNTIKTLMSYELVSKNTGKPVPCTYRENGKSHHNVKVDEDIRTMVAIISAMFSGENHRLDSADLNNFLNYNRITGYQPKLTLLDFYSKTLNPPQGLTVMSLVSLSTKNIDYSIDIPVEYMAEGILPDSLKDAFNIELPLHICMINGYFNGVINNLIQKLNTFDEAKNAVIEKSIISDIDLRNSESVNGSSLML